MISTFVFNRFIGKSPIFLSDHNFKEENISNGYLSSYVQAARWVSFLKLLAVSMQSRAGFSLCHKRYSYLVWYFVEFLLQRKQPAPNVKVFYDIAIFFLPCCCCCYHICILYIITHTTRGVFMCLWPCVRSVLCNIGAAFGQFLCWWAGCVKNKWVS